MARQLRGPSTSLAPASGVLWDRAGPGRALKAGTSTRTSLALPAAGLGCPGAPGWAQGGVCATLCEGAWVQRWVLTPPEAVPVAALFTALSGKQQEYSVILRKKKKVNKSKPYCIANLPTFLLAHLLSVKSCNYFFLFF